MELLLSKFSLRSSIHPKYHHNETAAAETATEAEMSEEMGRVLIPGDCSCLRLGPDKAHMLPFAIAYYDDPPPVSHYFHLRISPDVILEGFEMKEATFRAAWEKTPWSNRESLLVYLSSFLSSIARIIQT